MIDQVNLGQTGLTVSRLCFGTGTQGGGGRSQQSDLGLDGLSDLLRFGYDHGITFWDGADQYGTHAHIAEALQSVDRDTVTITTKTTSRRAADIDADVERYLRELKTEHIDILLLHCLTDGDWPTTQTEAMDCLSAWKEKGVVGAVGCSCHDIDALEASADSDWTDVNLVRVNYDGTAMCAGPQRVVPIIERMVAAGKGVYGMKVVGGGGDLTHDPAKAVRFVCEQTPVHALVMGMTSKEQVIENAGLVSEYSAIPA